MGAIITSAVVSGLMLAGVGYQIYRHSDELLMRLSQKLPKTEQPDFKSLQAQLQRQDEAILALKEQIASLPVNTSNASAIDTQRLTELEASLSQLQQASVPAQDIQEMRNQLNQLSLIQQGLGQQLQLQNESNQARPDLRLLASFQSLRAKAQEGVAFQDSLQRFLALSPSHPNLHETAQQLEIYASAGRPSLEELRAEFKTSMKEYLQNRDGVDNSLGGKVKRNLAEFITIRKMDTNGDSAIAILNRAQQDIEAGRIRKAIEALQDLPKDVQPAFAVWQEEAKAYDAIPTLLMKLDQQLADILMQSVPADHAS